MYSPLSQNFLRRVAESGRRKTVVDIYYDGVMVASDLPVSDGNIRVELDGQIRRSGSVTIADPRLVPTLSKALSPLGTEVRVRQGVVYPNGDEELVPLGIFRLEVTDWQETAAIPTAQLYDRSKGLATTGIRGSISRSGWMASAVIVEFLNWYYPHLNASYATVFDPGVTDYRIPGGHTFNQGSYWDAISELAKNMGGRLYFDVSGSPKVSPVIELTSVVGAVLDLAAGEGGVLVDAGHSYSREGIYNGVTVVGATTPEGGIVEASLYNTDPSSPLRYGGPFGKAISVIEDTTLTTDAQCYQRARTELARYTGLGYSLDFTAIPNPALDAGDFVRFVYADGRVEVHQIDTLSIPLGPGTFTGSSKGLILGA